MTSPSFKDLVDAAPETANDLPSLISSKLTHNLRSSRDLSSPSSIVSSPPTHSSRSLLTLRRPRRISCNQYVPKSVQHLLKFRAGPSTHCSCNFKHGRYRALLDNANGLALEPDDLLRVDSLAPVDKIGPVFPACDVDYFDAMEHFDSGLWDVVTTMPSVTWYYRTGVEVVDKDPEAVFRVVELNRLFTDIFTGRQQSGWRWGCCRDRDEVIFDQHIAEDPVSNLGREAKQMTLGGPGVSVYGCLQGVRIQ